MHLKKCQHLKKFDIVQGPSWYFKQAVSVSLRISKGSDWPKMAQYYKFKFLIALKLNINGGQFYKNNNIMQVINK